MAVTETKESGTEWRRERDSFSLLPNGVSKLLIPGGYQASQVTLLEQGTHSTHTAVSVPLSRGLHALVSLEDADRVLAHKWSAVWNGWSYYARRYDRGRNVYLHRFILEAPAGMQVDHKDGDGLNCQRANLRLASSTQNGQNRSRRKASAFKGVTSRGKLGYQARITVNGESVSVGYFATAGDAALAYDRAAREHFGEFARLNFPEVAK